MTDRQGMIADFLARHGWGQARRCLLADDASFRRYERLERGDETAILMDAPPEFEDVQPFVTVARYLRSLGLAAPEIYAGDMARGLLLLEDMGDDLFARVIRDDPGREKALYRLAVDGLLHLHKFPVPENFPRYDRDMLGAELGLFVDWYLPGQDGHFLTDGERTEFLALWHRTLAPLMQGPYCLTLRDYHAENLMVRPYQKGQENHLSRLGLLDFQDAVIGHPAYDLVSLLQDARRDVSCETEQEMLDYYLKHTGGDREDFCRDYAILGAQRNLKIIGIFTRLYLRDGKSTYLDKIPRVRALLDRDLAHPALAEVRAWLERYTPPADSRPRPLKPEKAMILAAGLGTRMRPLTADCPKPLIRVAEKELLSWSLDGLCAAGVRDVVINIHYRADQMVDFVKNYYDPRLQLTLSDERAELLDSGGGVKKALGYFGDEPFLILNSDMIWRDGPQQMLRRMQARWQPENMDILMLLVPKDSATGYDGAGDYDLASDGRLTARGQAPEADYVYGGIMIVRPECFRDAPDGPFSLRRQFDAAEKSGRLSGIIHDGEWYHVGTPEMRGVVEKRITDAQKAEENT